MIIAPISIAQIAWGIIALALVGGLGWALVTWFRAWQLCAQAWLVGYHAGIVDMLLLQMRGADIVQLVNAAILAKREGITVSIDELAHHQLACGNIRVVVNALLSAKRNQFPLAFERAAAIDLMGQDPVRLVADAVHEANQIRVPHPATGAGIFVDALPPITPQPRVNAAAVLLQATPGVVGVMVGDVTMQALMRFPHGDLQVQVRSASRTERDARGSTGRHPAHATLRS